VTNNPNKRISPNFLRKSILYLIVIAVVVAIFFVIMPRSASPQQLSLSELEYIAKSGQVVQNGTAVDNNLIKSIEESGYTLTVTFAKGDSIRLPNGSTIEISPDKKAEASIPSSGLDTYKLFSDQYGINYSYKTPSSFNWGSLLFTVLPLLIFIGFMWWIFSRARGAGNQALNFGRSKARLFTGTKSTVTFNDVAGVDEAKQELQEVVEFLKSPKKFSALGARIPRGVLLVGAPGTGKTLLSRAVAGEAGVPFFSMSGSEFVEMFVGVGASRVRDLFEQAKRNSPCIVFIDEIDAVGRQRGAGFGGGHDEREQTLNQILVEMDGFDTSTNVIVLAATNRPDVLDPALLRPGRFDRQVVLDRPDIKGRKAILKVHAKDIPLEDGVDLEIIAKQTPGFTGADLANLMNEAAILAARREKKKISMSELEESVDRVIAGPQRKSKLISPKEKEITAYHEAGHAIVAHFLPNADPVHKISIIARGMMGGYTRLLPTEDRNMWTYAQFNDTLATMLGGHTAENLIFGQVTTGAGSDLEQVARISRRMVTDYGMSEKLGPRTFGRRGELIFLGREVTEEQKDYSEKTAESIDDEVHNIVQRAQIVAREVLNNNKEKLVKLAEALIVNETIEVDALEAILGKRAAAEPSPKPAA
jgi:cell division protease FtsH